MEKKKISECKVEEIMFNHDFNVGNKNFEQVYQIILVMFDSIKDYKEAQGQEMNIMNQAWQTVKNKIDKSVMNSEINIKKG